MTKLGANDCITRLLELLEYISTRPDDIDYDKVDTLKAELQYTVDVYAPYQINADGVTIDEIGKWLSAAVEDDAVCDEYKEAANEWFNWVEEYFTRPVFEYKFDGVTYQMNEGPLVETEFPDKHWMPILIRPSEGE